MVEGSFCHSALRGWADYGKTVVACKADGAVDLVHLVCLVYLVQPNKRDKPNKQEQPVWPRISRATLGAAEVGNDESCVGDRVCREGGCVLMGYRGAQSFCCLADGKREGFVLLNLSETGHRIPEPLWKRELRQPRFGREGYGSASADSRLSVVVGMPCGLGFREFLFNERCWCHRGKSLRSAG